MQAYGYEVKGNLKVLADIRRNVKCKDSNINWKNFNSGDRYYTDNCEEYRVTIDHEEKQVMLVSA